MNKQYYVYLISNKHHNVLYTGVTNDLARRLYEHRHSKIKGFSSKYNVNCLVYYEVFEVVDDAIAREKQIKSWARAKKNELIEQVNKEWRDLAKDLI